MNKRLRALIGQRNAVAEKARTIHNTAADTNRELTAEEQTQFDAHMAEVSQFNRTIEREQAVDEATRTAGTLEAPPGGRVEVVGERVLQDPRHGFDSFGQFAHAVMQAGLGHAIDQRLAIVAAAPTTYGNEGSLQDGGFLVPPEFSREVFQHSLEEDAILPLTDDYPVQGNTLTFPRDETTPWGSDGIRAYWENEAGVATQTKPKGAVSQLRLSKLFALVPVTDELMADAGALERYIGRKTSESIRWKSNEALWAGTGVGQPLGVFGCPAEVVVLKEAGQAADTVLPENVAKMYARMPAAALARAVWQVNNDVLPQLMVMKVGDRVIWTPPQEGFRNAPGGLLLGRPIRISQHAKTIGDKGDISFIDWKHYRTITKAGQGIETATSMHFFFDSGATAFRATFRIDGQPAIQAPITPANGSNNLSPFVQLEAR